MIGCEIKLESGTTGTSLILRLPVRRSMVSGSYGLPVAEGGNEK